MTHTKASRFRRRRIGVAAVALTTALVLAACSGGSVTGNSGGDANGETKIVVWHTITGTNAKVLQSIVADYNKSQSKYVVQPQFAATSDQLDAKLINALKNKQGPNMVLGDSTPQNVGEVITTGQVVALDDKLAASGSSITKDSFTKGFLSTGTFDGKVYSLPTDGGDYALIYNKAMFKEAGITDPPKTWAELAADAAKLTDGHGQYGIYLPIGTGEWPVFTWQSMLWSAGGEFLNSDNTKPAFDSPEGVKALTAWTDLVSKGYAYPQSLATPSDNNGTAAMTAKKVAMEINGSFNLGTMDSALGKENVGVAPLPALDKPAMNIGTDNSYLLKGTKAQEAGSWDFLTYWLSPDVQAKWDIPTGTLPTNTKTADTKTYKAFLEKNPRMKTFVDQLAYAQSRPSISSYADISAALSTELEKAMLQKESPSDALKNAAAAAQKALQK